MDLRVECKIMNNEILQSPVLTLQMGHLMKPKEILGPCQRAERTALTQW